MQDEIRLLSVSYQPLLRAGIRSSLQTEKDLIIVGEATNTFEAQHLSFELKPNVLLIDLHTPGFTLPKTVSNLSEQCPESNLLMLANSDNIHLPNLIKIGIAGCVPRDEDTQIIAQAIYAVAHGDTWFSQPTIEKFVQKEIGDPTSTRELSLTSRERQVLSMIALGWDNFRISRELNLAKQTVRNYISCIYTKIMVNSRAEAVIRAREYGFHI